MRTSDGIQKLLIRRRIDMGSSSRNCWADSKMAYCSTRSIGRWRLSSKVRICFRLLSLGVASLDCFCVVKNFFKFTCYSIHGSWAAAAWRNAVCWSRYVMTAGPPSPFTTDNCEKLSAFWPDLDLDRFKMLALIISLDSVGDSVPHGLWPSSFLALDRWASCNDNVYKFIDLFLEQAWILFLGGWFVDQQPWRPLTTRF